jgi:hypothetical protein
MRYGEGTFVGNRYDERPQIAPFFLFGHGRSYTGFAYSKFRFSDDALAPDCGSPFIAHLRVEKLAPS